MNQNGLNQDVQAPGPPVITLAWDPNTHGVQVNFDVRNFRTLDFVRAVLLMGVASMEAAIRQQQGIKMAQAMQQQEHDAAIKRRLMGGH